MRKFNISNETVLNVVATIGSCLAIGVLAMCAPHRATRMDETTTDYFHVPSYSDAVKAIMEEFAFDSSRQEAIQVLRRDGDADYYMAVIEAIKGSTFDSNRIELIKILSDK